MTDRTDALCPPPATGALLKRVPRSAALHRLEAGPANIFMRLE